MKNAELIVAHKPKSSVAEAIKTIRTNLQFSAVNGDVKSILVTSSMPGEGKSFVASNLAVAFAQAGSKVLIVDCDMRRGRPPLPGVGGGENPEPLRISHRSRSYLCPGYIYRERTHQKAQGGQTEAR